MPCLSKKAVALTAYRFSSRFLLVACAFIVVLSVALAQAQDQPAAGTLRGIVAPPPGAETGFPTQPVPPPTPSAPGTQSREENPFQGATADIEEAETGSSRPPSTVFPPPESPYDVDMAKLGFRVVSAEVVDRLFFAGGGTQHKPLEPGPGRKLVVATLQGKVSTPIRMPIAIPDFSAFWVEERVRDLYGKKVSERVIQVTRAVALETPRGWLIEGQGLPNAAVYFFVNPGPVSLRVGFFLPEGIKRFSVRYPLIADGDAIIVSGPPPAKK